MRAGQNHLPTILFYFNSRFQCYIFKILNRSKISQSQPYAIKLKSYTLYNRIHKQTNSNIILKRHTVTDGNMPSFYVLPFVTPQYFLNLPFLKTHNKYILILYSCEVLIRFYSCGTHYAIYTFSFIPIKEFNFWRKKWLVCISLLLAMATMGLKEIKNNEALG